MSFPTGLSKDHEHLYLRRTASVAPQPTAMAAITTTTVTTTMATIYGHEAMCEREHSDPVSEAGTRAGEKMGRKV